MGLVDANSAGYVHGGTVMKLCDEVAGLAAVRHSRCRVVTAGVDRMTFQEPIHIGELVTFTASVNAAWRTSMEVGVRVEAEHPREGTVRHTNTAYLTMVALDDDGRPTEVPPLEVVSEDEVRREREAQTRRRNRLAERDEIQRGRRSGSQNPSGWRFVKPRALRRATRQRGPRSAVRAILRLVMPPVLVSRRRPAMTAKAWPGFEKTVIQVPVPFRPQRMKLEESSGLLITLAASSA